MRHREQVDARAARTWVDATLATCMRRVNRWDFARQVVITLMIATLLAGILHTTVGSFVVQGDSMWPLLQSGDQVLVDQLAYRIGAPARGDVVIFRFPRLGSDLSLVKRVIGLPGDTVEIRPGLVLVNGRRLSEPYVQDVEQYSYGPRTVPEGHYFVLGDNRERNGVEISYDSHQWGFVPADDLYGRVMLTYWPLDHVHRFGL